MPSVSSPAAKSCPAAHGRCRVVLDVARDGQQARLATGVSCQPAHFSPEARQVVMRKDPNATRLNYELTDVETAVNTVFTLASAHSRRVNEAELVAAARAALGKKPAAKRAAPETPPACRFSPPLRPATLPRPHSQDLNKQDKSETWSLINK